MSDRSRIPDQWPRGMRDEVAAAYIGVSVSKFLALVRDGVAPPAVWLTSHRKVWLRDHLDNFLDRLADQAAPAAGWRENMDDWKTRRADSVRLAG